MSQFYTRYVPTASKKAAPRPQSPQEKRKRDDQPQQGRKHKKPRVDVAEDDGTIVDDEHPPLDTDPRSPQPPPVRSILNKYRVTQTPRQGGSASVPQNLDTNASAPEGVKESTPDLKTRKPKKQKTKSSSIVREQASDGGDEPDEQDKRHASILSKFEKARASERTPKGPQDSSDTSPPPQLHGLEPIPQPDQPDILPEKPSYSVLPQWQEHALRPSPQEKKDFESLGLSGTILQNLSKNGFRDAFPIQTAMLPLLLPGPNRYPGDVCVSAATGSGKTLAYVLPLVASLQDLACTKLRAVIVVPTRELVKQVRELCEMCAAGTSLKIATAVGSKSLKEEQDMLVEEKRIYNPSLFREQQSSLVDWHSFSLEKLAESTRRIDLLEDLGFIVQHRSKVDILITTPGRLVDHLRSTPGFSLEHVEWLVVDEADRLLNESYQEWIEVVAPALRSRAASKTRDDLLTKMSMSLPPRKVTKILLSATMTRDISKLNAIGLHAPKLVILGGVDSGHSQAEGLSTSLTRVAEDKVDQSIAFHLPASLEEIVVPVPDGSEKPLYLLALLDRISRIPVVSNDSQTPNGRASHGSSSGSESESETETDSSSDASDSVTDSSDDTSSDEEDTSTTESSSPPAHKMQNKSQSRSSVQSETNSSQRMSRQPRTLIFARSTASATRLARLLSLVRPSLSNQLSTLTRSTTSSASSRQALSAFRSSKISILIATDRASRGLDVPGLEHVVSYDIPNSALTYIHRAGRTARAGQGGYAWSLLEHREAAWFWREIGGKGDKATALKGLDSNTQSIDRQSNIKRVNVKVEDESLRQHYEKALEQLGTEARGS
ncbi:hypothetical protein PV10_01096 [Exophiala mesophila]|uniref:ATP-dependent RNA helicase n=1 Tax=Exophiala mesophila TaxID=212818 RepID=A0A0D1ZTS4_EXOME|nr:uncharacterized protein PV10_01096 [Exophiala mesophila]KIV97334.1 hypothetical protein PV10_01096 [Exophiala mesophila]